MLVLVIWCYLVSAVKGEVLDPALYLSPSPPLTPAETDGQNLWSLPRMQREADLGVIPIEQVKTITSPSPCATNPTSSATQQTTSSTNPTSSATQATTKPTKPTSLATQPITTPTNPILASTKLRKIAPLSSTSQRSRTTQEDEMLEKAETFWPSLRTTGAYFGIHVPLTFALTGNYGRYGSSNGGVIASSYASVSEDGDSGLFKLYGKAGLAGSSYGTYSGGTRIYGKGTGASWSGWGNGKWGHYGKG